MLPVGEMLERFEGVRKVAATKWMCNCPAHEDHNGSLCITLNEDAGKWILHCYAGCLFKDVCAVTGIEPSKDLFLAPAERAKWKPREVDPIRAMMARYLAAVKGPPLPETVEGEKAALGAIWKAGPAAMVLCDGDDKAAADMWESAEARLLYGAMREVVRREASTAWEFNDANIAESMRLAMADEEQVRRILAFAHEAIELA